ncbi:uncharacterized protein LOC121592984 [Anopheles merus]|uniref:uncharacterized protein LOC121592984 n=1 Tax=Anopheles merus TaxID=30066 RepID=UPI001BE4096B|nr:uncharacterized protein LOC121592984 [Anopheles merus]
MATKEEMLCALEYAKVNVPTTATISQLRKLYNANVGNIDEPGVLSNVPTDIETSKAEGKLALSTELVNAENNGAAILRSAVRHAENNAVSHDSTSVGTLENATHLVPNPVNTAPSVHEEIELLKKKLEILELKQRISLLEAPVVTHTTQQPLFIKFNEFVDVFSGDKGEHVDRWFKELERTFLPYRMDGTMKFHSTRQLLTGTAALFAKSLDITTYHELKNNLIQNFGTTTSLENVYKQLRGRRLARNEPVIRYILDMQAMACDVPIPEMDLINIIIDGLGDPINEAWIRFSAKSMGDLKQLLKRYEEIRPRNAATPSSSGSICQPLGSSSNQQSEVRCYNCSKFGHYKSSCPMPRRPPGSCFKCHQAGHAARNCPNNIIIPSAAAHHSVQDNVQQETFNTDLEEFQQEAQ